MSQRRKNKKRTKAVSIVNRNMEAVKNLNIMDDMLFFKICESKKACEEILSVILGRPITVIDHRVQFELRNAGTRSVRLDCLCIDGDGNYINIEVQKDNNDNHIKRVRYNVSNIDTSFSEKGIKFEELPEVWVIYISKFDIFGYGDIINHVKEVLAEHLQHQVCSGVHKIFVNASVHDGSDLDEMMKYFTKSSGVNMKFPELSDRVRFFKETEKGNQIMCDTINNMMKESYVDGREDGKYEILEKYIAKNGCTQEEAIEALDFTAEEAARYKQWKTVVRT